MPHRKSIVNALLVSAVLAAGVTTALFWAKGVAAQSKPRVSSVVLNPSTVVGGASATCAITLSANAPAGGTTVTITNSNAAAATVQTSVLVPQGQSTVNVTVTTKAVASATSAVITATANSGSKSATLTINPPALTSVRVSPASVLGGNSSTGTVVLSGAAPTGGMVVSLQSTVTSVATTPASVTVAGGSSSATFQVTTFAVQTTTPATINGTLNGVTRSATLTVEAPNKPPAVSLTAPASGQTFTAPATIVLNADASDPDGTISRVRFLRGTTLINDDASAPYTFTWSNVAAGTYSLTAQAVDNKGATATSQAVTVTVSSEASGEITRFADRATFDKASADRAIVNFEGLAPAGDFKSYGNPGSLSAGGAFFVTNNYLFIQNNNSFGTGSIFSAQQGTDPQVVTVMLPANVTAVGTDFYSGFPVQVTLSTGQQYTLQGRPYPNLAFAGFTSTVAISSLQFVMTSGIDLDNFVYGRGLPNPTVQMTALDAVVKGSTASVTVNVAPEANEIPVTLSLQAAGGTGEARFADGSASMTVTRTTTVQITGVTEGSAADNIRLEAKVGETAVTGEDFSVVKLELVTPDGDPINAAVQAGDGQNEFTYNSDSPGVLAINFKARATPTSPAILNTIHDEVRFTVAAVGGSTLAWDAANPGGVSSVTGADLTARLTFTGLPGNNADFGPKLATLEYGTARQDESTLEVFYPKDATNHPGGQAGSPNWFHYWGQALGVADAIYSNARPDLYGEAPGMLHWSYTAAPDKVHVIIYDLAATVDAGDASADGGMRRTTGIDTFEDTYLHERHHTNQISRADAVVGIIPLSPWRFGWSWNEDAHNHWGRGPDGQPGAAGVDDDGDGATDNLLTTGPGELGNGDDVLLDRGHDWPQAFGLLPPLPWAGGGPIEDEAYNREPDNENQRAALDWGNPGKQHRTLNRYDD